MMPREVRSRSKEQHNPGVQNTFEIAKTMEKIGIDAKNDRTRKKA